MIPDSSAAPADHANSLGQKRSEEEYAEPNRANGLHALLESPVPAVAEGDALPPLWHWIYFWERGAQSGLAEDGHAERGGFLPASSLPRRMWAGSDVTWKAPLHLGERWHRHSLVEDVTPKEGRSGRLLFVTVRHEIESGGQICLTERQSIVYREAARPGAPAPKPIAPPAEPLWQRPVQPDSRLLFRYSALTFNAHRIHYDEPYVREVEGYPALVVHGPLLATLMVDLVLRERPRLALRSFRFRALSPIFANQGFRVCGLPEGDSVRLWVETDNGLAMDGSAGLAQSV